MFIYAIAKGVRQRALAGDCLRAARTAYAGAVDRFVTVDDQGLLSLGGTCSVAGLGGNPYRDGSFDYYVGEPVATNDYKGVGAFILASVEIEKARAGSATGDPTTS
jgi:unsaturated rhamnogalacturonyl hydrolase